MKPIRLFSFILGFILLFSLSLSLSGPHTIFPNYLGGQTFLTFTNGSDQYIGFILFLSLYVLAFFLMFGTSIFTYPVSIFKKQNTKEKIKFISTIILAFSVITLFFYLYIRYIAI